MGIYGYFSLWVFMVVFTTSFMGIYGRIEPSLWVWRAVLVHSEVYTGEGDRKYIFRRREKGVF